MLQPELRIARGPTCLQAHTQSGALGRSRQGGCLSLPRQRRHCGQSPGVLPDGSPSLRRVRSRDLSPGDLPVIFRVKLRGTHRTQSLLVHIPLALPIIHLTLFQLVHILLAILTHLHLLHQPSSHQSPA